MKVVTDEVTLSGFDGVVVYNTATGKTGSDANTQGKVVDVTPGFYYFSNPNGATTQTVSDGKWIRLGSGNETNQPWVYNAEGNAVLNYPLSKINAEFSKDQFILKNVNDDAYQYYSTSVDGGRTKVSNSLFENSAFSQLFKVSKLTINNPLKPSNGLNSVFVLDKDAAQTSEVNGNIMNTFTDAENTQNYNNLRGLTALSSHNGTGSVSQLIGSLGMSVTFPFSTTTNQYGMFGQASNYSDNPMTNLTGIRAYASHRGNGTLTTLRGLESVVNAITAATGDITDAIGVSSNVLFNNDQYTGNITTIKGLNITQSITPTIATKVTNNYGLFIGDVTAGTRPYSIYTGAGAVRFGDLKGTGNRVVLADAEGKLTTGSVSSGDLGLWTNDAANTATKIKNLSDGITARTDDNNVFISDGGYVGIGVGTPIVDMHIQGKVGKNAEILLSRFNDNGNGANMTLMKSNGTPENPVVAPVGSSLGRYRVGGYTGGGDGTNNQTSSGYDGFASNIETFVAGNPNTNGTLPTNMIFNVTNDIGGRNTLLKLQGNSGVGVGFATTEDIKARLQVNDWNDVSLTSTNNAFMIGKENTYNLVMDGNEIMARNNGQASGLSLQAQGGDLFVNTEDADITKRFYFRSNTGNLGLGITTPTEKLEVAGKVKATSFAGTNGATLFPDYVFQKYYTGTSSIKADYSFKTLSQVEDFVKTNGHLPGYPSAEAIKKQGYIDLMATQLTNVEKIEELYLHSIEQDKALKSQKEELKAKDAKIAELEARLQKLEALLVK
ncbi:hypothetical protein [Riemerella anatipestifer]|uniref:hypothetical protein n=1 Tax=Riemerella anatipestifer TaxID=34085 RepID=UPI00129DCC8F|nr:hypothetical protein [Riemerella anatipestifer]MBT0551831.1 hypothetical protein [Riemerella anatipestifer]MBT0554085.1 hypothetical protein [Riemerella anatipestifer]MCE3024684.1 hypothetical protein [Riemerella anatipestifer]MCU7541632.1 hypothetical protein [Riemerella anatipestifer]MCU7560356.1 hypothetical protein [Riemerella anatipestifer]